MALKKVKEIDLTLVEAEKAKQAEIAAVTEEVKTARGNEADLSTKLGKKVDAVAGKALSTNDYTTTEKTKLSGIAAGATKNTVTDSVTSTSTTDAASAASVKKAYDLINTANTTASDAKTIAQQANTTANNANTKSDNAVSTANSANTTAQSANTKADNAVSTANTAKTTADKVRADFDILTQNDTNAEVINARTNKNGATFANLKERLDYVDDKIKQAELPNIYGIKIDTTNSNPATALTYIDDAQGFMPAKMDFITDTFNYGSWADKYPFNQIRPCLVKDGQVVGYLNPNDYSKFVDGSNADITSGDSGDVMVEFPKVFWKFETIGTDLYVRYSKERVDDNYKCLAHMKGTTEKDKVYISAYLGFNLSSKLRSLSGKTPTASKTIGAFRTLAQTNGTGYDQMAYYQTLMLQVLYIVMFKDRNSQSALGRGYVDGNTAATTTGNLNNKGLFYGENTGKVQMKFCGVEDFYGNLYYWIDGVFSDASYNILIGNQSFNNTGSGYTFYGQGATADLSGYIGAVQGGTETGFIVKTATGSATTYYPDNGVLYASRIAIFGGVWASASSAGAFQLRLSSIASDSGTTIGARLMFC